MQARTRKISKGMAIAFAAAVGAACLVLAGCSVMSAVSNNPGNPASGPTTAVPMTITDAPGDQVLAASLTLNSIVLTDTAGKTASVLSAPYTFEAAHLDAVQEPLFTPAVPEDTYTSVALTYSNAQVAYVDTTTHQVVLTTATLANNAQTITFASPVTVSTTRTSLLVDFLVAKSVAISGTAVTVTPAFNILAAPIPQQPTNGTNGLLSGFKGKVTALGTNSFTLATVSGATLTINVNSNTQYQGLSGFSALAVGALIEVDTQTQPDGSLLALRVEERVAPNATAALLVGPVTAVTGAPATGFTMLVRERVGPAATAAPVEHDTIAVTGTTQFLMPGRFTNLAPGALPFTPTFSAATLFAGQSVAVVTSNLASNAATAQAVAMEPQTVSGTIAAMGPANGPGVLNVYTLTLPPGHWLAQLTGLSTVTVYTNGNLQAINSTPVAAGTAVRFNGFLFKVNGSLVMLACVQADGPGNPVTAHP